MANRAGPDPKFLSMNDKPLTPDQSIFKTTPTDYASTVLDDAWARNSFLIGNAEFSSKVDQQNRFYTTANTKFTDTRMGGNVGINSRPQFCRYSDLRVKGRLTGRNDVSIGATGNFGMGRYYSEAIDDNSQLIYLRFGVPEFNSIGNFLNNFYNPVMATWARTGRAPSVAYTLGKAVGTLAFFRFFPVLSIAIAIGALDIVSDFFEVSTSRWYSLKPTMHTYWGAVNTVVNMIAVNKGLLPPFLDSGSDQQIGTGYQIDPAYMAELRTFLPDIFTSDYGIDVYAIANKAQRIANALFENDYSKFNDNTSYTEWFGHVLKESQGAPLETKVQHPSGEHSFLNFLNNFFMLKRDDTGSSGSGVTAYKSTEATGNTVETSIKLDDKGDPVTAPPNDFKDMLNAEWRDGSAFAVFRVDNTGSMSESFSNSVTESELSQKLNSMVSGSRETSFNFASGHLGNNIFASAIESTFGAIKDLTTGALDGLHISGLASVLLGSVNVDIPKHWESSSASLPHASYTMQLISPYGNLISQMQNIYIPLAMLLAGALPLSTGKQSHTSPYICQLFDRGRCQIKLGMIDSLSITRGTSNLPFNNRGKALAIDVSFTVIDMSSIMSMPISRGQLFGALDSAGMDGDNPLTDYLAVLAGQDIYSQIYTLPKAKLKLAKAYRYYESFTSPARWAGFFHEEMTTGSLSWMIWPNAISAMIPGMATNFPTQQQSQ